ncbi:DinB family protein [Aquibacillus saliphilus]|uniref:DinB family protein n=1 Tax=Aquibacillus saliphilus TaxID=1909422 RepID=UPI001CEFF4BD|nr:DinB family protein [Aquibacillus saliphilus]
MAKINGFITSWMSHRKVIIEIIDTLEDEHLNFKPWEDAMSLSELVLHTTGATSMFTTIVKEDSSTSESSPKKADSIEELKSIVESQTEKTKTDLESISDEQLDQLVEFAGMKLPGIALLENGKDHEIHHKGQLFTYARLIGIETLPFFVNHS